MRDLIILYRPFVNIGKSVECLSDFDMPVVGKLQCSHIIKSILGELKLVDFREKGIIENNSSTNYYWNKGKPFLWDLILYYKTALSLWPERGGSREDLLAGFWPAIAQCKWKRNRSPWSVANGNVHKFLLLERDHFWYQRFFCEGKLAYRYRRLISTIAFINGKPRQLPTANIMKATHEIARPDHSTRSRQKDTPQTPYPPHPFH